MPLGAGTAGHCRILLLQASSELRKSGGNYCRGFDLVSRVLLHGTMCCLDVASGFRVFQMFFS